MSRAVHSVLGGDLCRGCVFVFADDGGGDVPRDHGGSGRCLGS